MTVRECATLAAPDAALASRSGLRTLESEAATRRVSQPASVRESPTGASDFGSVETGRQMESLLVEALEPRQNRKRSDAFLAV
jgi:hypothetical protein